MADTAVAITAGSGTNIDTRTEATNGNHRQVVVLGDPSTNAGVAPVDATNGLAVDVKLVGGQAPAYGSGAVGSTVPRVVLATDSPGVGLAEASTTSGQLGSLIMGAHVNAEKTALTNGQTGAIATTLTGKQIVVLGCNPENIINGTTSALTDTTSTQVIAAQGSGVRIYVTDIMVTNSSATATFVTIRDGNGGSILWEGYAPAGSGWTRSFITPLRGTANTRLDAKCETTSTNTIVSINGFKGS